VFKKLIRRATREADDDLVPEWPEAHRCKCCGDDVWRVVREDGESISLDTRPIETHLILGKVRVRDKGFYREDEEHPLAWKRAAVWRLNSPRFVHANEYVVDGELSDAWLWTAKRVPLETADPGIVYSEHYHLCTGQSAKSVLASFTSFPAHRGAMVYSHDHDRALMTRVQGLSLLPSEARLLNRRMRPAAPPKQEALLAEVLIAATSKRVRRCRSRAGDSHGPSQQAFAGESSHSLHPTADQLPLF
jgi:hypothetical protein